MSYESVQSWFGSVQLASKADTKTFTEDDSGARAFIFSSFQI